MMTNLIDFLIDTPNGQRSITIEPVNVNPAGEVTGQYTLKEGNAGIGTITFTSYKDWTFDGAGDINNNDLKNIAGFIKKTSGKQFNNSAPAVQAAGNQAAPALLGFIITDKDEPADVCVAMNYPFYDVTIGGSITAQLQQDHHSNWFITQGQLSSHLVQEIGRRISLYVLG